MNALPIGEIIEFRKELHKNPELSGKESGTAERVIAFIERYHPDQILKGLGGDGVAVVYEGNEAGSTILIRCELDALPIQEINDFAYKSEIDGVSHKCGHDGHMAIVSGLAPLLHQKPLKKGRVILMFQPAEETGEGAKRVIKDARFESIKPDYAFSLHNLPKYPKGKVLFRSGTFNAASKGMKVLIKGRTAHAAEPENGLNPAIAVSHIIQELLALPQKELFKDFVLITLTHVQIGEKAFGVSAGDAEILATLRAYRDDDMQMLSNEALKMIEENLKDTNLTSEVSWHEAFPASVNHKAETELIKKVAQKNGFGFEELKEPIRWSEDFAYFTAQAKGAMFGLGSGELTPHLHNPDYDFPDDIIETGITMFYDIICELLD
ncbi:MAG: amidohydrolase [Bacteroidota bacterium]